MIDLFALNTTSTALIIIALTIIFLSRKKYVVK
jgi:hypothetical protein